ncbi:MAG TPA: head GIN domain-containing protein [Bryobacteraceae bacterium]
MNHLAALTVVSLSVIASGCLGPSVIGSGRATTENRNVGGGFSRVRLSGSGRVVIDEGTVDSVAVTTDDNIQSYVRTDLEGTTLVLGQKGGTFLLSPSAGLLFKVTVRNLDEITVSGSGAAEVREFQNSRLRVVISGSGDASVDGTVDDLSVSVSGSGRFRGEDLRSKRARVDISGSGSASVAASDILDAIVSGSGSVRYIGDPQVHESVSGSGSVRRR